MANAGASTRARLDAGSAYRVHERLLEMQLPFYSEMPSMFTDPYINALRIAETGGVHCCIVQAVMGAAHVRMGMGVCLTIGAPPRQGPSLAASVHLTCHVHTR